MRTGAALTAEHFDAIVIGTGQAGPSLAARLAAAGMKTAVIEREHLGGTCVNDGCTPTKTLVASARVAHVVRTASAFGVGPESGLAVTVDMQKIKARKDAVVKASVDGLAKWLSETENLTLIWGEARFVAPHVVRVGTRELSAPKIFINAGCRPSVPDFPGLHDVPFLTNTSIMALDVLPRHLAIIGGSYIGLEFAQIYRRFGAEVTVIEGSERVIRREDAEFSESIRAILEAEGVRIITSACDIHLARAPDGIELGYRLEQGAGQLNASHLLLAVGRRPNTEALDLPLADIKTDARGFIVVDDRLETSAPGVFALGDINGRGAFTHTSYNDYEIVASNLFEGATRRVSDRPVAYALFIDPPLGRVGITEDEARKSGKAVLIGRMPMTRSGRASERGETLGMMKILIDAATKQILGASFLGIEADEVIHVVMMAMAARAPYLTLKTMMGIHPTVAEMLPTLLQDMKPL